MPNETAVASPGRLLRFPEVRERVGLSRSTIWHMAHAGGFPHPPSSARTGLGGWSAKCLSGSRTGRLYFHGGALDRPAAQRLERLVRPSAARAHAVAERWERRRPRIGRPSPFVADALSHAAHHRESVAWEVLGLTGHAISVAVVVGWAIEGWAHLKFAREVSRDVAAVLIGYRLPQQLQDHIRGSLNVATLVRHNHHHRYELAAIPEDPERVHVAVTLGGTTPPTMDRTHSRTAPWCRARKRITPSSFASLATTRSTRAR
jgi:predicted DNA-binding transcriptional regulator AlpA